MEINTFHIIIIFIIFSKYSRIHYMLYSPLKMDTAIKSE